MKKKAFNAKWWLLPLCLMTLTALTALPNPPPALALDAGAVFTPGPSMIGARMAHCITTLPDGRVIVFGGHAPGFGLSYTADVFDPVANTWTSKAMNYPHDLGAVARLQDGRYLLAGGCSSGSGVGQSSTAEIYDPASNTFTSTGPMTKARTWCNAATLTSGKVLVVGNWYADGSWGDIFDPATGTFTSTGSLISRANVQVLPTNDGGAVVFGGIGSYNGYYYYGQVEYYNPATNSFTVLRNTLLDDGVIYQYFDQSLEPGSRRLPDGRYLLYTWGADARQIIYTFDPATKQFARFNTSPAVPVPGAPWILSMFLDAARNKVYLLNGDAAYPTPSTQIRLYTMDAATGALNSPTEFYNLGRPLNGFVGVRYSDASTVLRDGRLLWTGGCFTVDNYGATNLTFLATPTAGPPAGNLPPVANAGTGQTVPVGSTVTLNGGLSFDPDGNNPLTYAWNFTSRPEGSAAGLVNPTSVSPSFVADIKGNYVVQLVVTDSKGASSNPASVTISTANSAPVADAGTGQTVPVSSNVTLDGSLSSDLDGDPLTYAWSFTSLPPGSAAVLVNPNSVSPNFVADKKGNYVLQLVVTDNRGASSNPASVIISTTNSAPVADAGPDQSVTLIGATVNLNALTAGRASYDLDGDPLTFKWDFLSKPAASQATLSGDDTATPSFVADVHAAEDYVVRLIVNDGITDSTPASVRVSFANVKPVADAGAGQSVTLGDTVTLNGTGSHDANGDSLTYQWSLATVPQGSTLGGYSSTGVTTTFVPDAPGDYVAKLVVNDGFVNGDPATVQILVAITRATVVTKLQALVLLISELDAKVFKNANMRNTMINKLNAVIKQVEAGDYAGAINKLDNDVLAKTNGCASGSGAATYAITPPPTTFPDNNDWITDCKAQGDVYPAVLEIIDMMMHLM